MPHKLRAFSFLLLAATFFVGSRIALATSGACSYHGGVNCAAGPATNGSVICNDGWMGSRVSYYAMSECVPYFSEFPSVVLQNKIQQYCYSKYLTDPNLPSVLAEREYEYCLSGGHPTLLDSCRAQLGPYGSLDAYGACTCVSGYATSAYSNQCSAAFTNLQNTASQTIMTSTTATSTVQMNTAAIITQNLRIGSSGDDVISLQHFLEQRGFLVIPAGVSDGYFGGLTKKALIAYQASVGLPDTGYCGPMTRNAIENNE